MKKYTPYNELKPLPFFFPSSPRQPQINNDQS